MLLRTVPESLDPRERHTAAISHWVTPAMPLAVSTLHECLEDEHRCEAVTPDPTTDPRWLDYLASEYRAMRTESRVPLTDVILDGTRFDSSVLANKLANYAIPDRSGGNLAVARSDFGETVAICLLRERFSTQFGYVGITDRELTQRPGRGIDAVGVEAPDGEPIRLVLNETKTSAEARNPPKVVDTGNESLQKQHKGHVGNREKTIERVWDAVRRAPTQEVQQLLAAAALYLESDNFDDLTLVLDSCMIRCLDTYSLEDFGSFGSNPDDYEPGTVRFTIFCVPQDIEETVTVWLQKAEDNEA